MESLRKEPGRNGDQETRSKEASTKNSSTWEEFKSYIPFGWRGVWNLVIFASIVWIVNTSLEHPELDGAKIGELSHAYWIQILIIGFGISFLIRLNAEDKAAIQLQKTLWTIMAVLLLGLPVWGWFVKAASGTESTEAQKIGCIVPYDAEKRYIPLTIYPNQDSCGVAFPPNGDLEMSAQYAGESIADLTRRYFCENGDIVSSLDACRNNRLKVAGVAWHNPRIDPVKISVEYVLGKGD